MIQIDFKDLVVIITGAGGGLGRAYALEYAKRGAKVVVNDLGNPDAVVEEITKLGGKAVADKNSCENGEAIVQTALNAYGKVHILINNAGILRDTSFLKMTEQQWQQVLNVHLHGSFKMTKACWELFNKQKFGRIVNTSSAAGIYGNYGQANYSSAKCGLHGFTQSLALQGQSNNVFCNTIAPIAKSKMTETVLPPDILNNLSPEYVAPLVLYLTHPSNTINGQLYEVGAGFVAKCRYVHSKGVSSNNPTEVASNWKQVSKFDQISLPSRSPSSQTASITPVSIDNVVVVTGTVNLQQTVEYLVKCNCKVVVTDKNGSSTDSILYHTTPSTLLQTIQSKFNKVDALVNLGYPPSSNNQMSSISSTEYNKQIEPLTHIFKYCKLFFPIFTKSTGHIISLLDSQCLVGSPNLVHSISHASLIGLMNTLAIEGQRKQVHCSSLFTTSNTSTLTSLAALLQLQVTGQMVLASNTISLVKIQRTMGVLHLQTPEQIHNKIAVINDFNKFKLLSSVQESYQQIFESFGEPQDAPTKPSTTSTSSSVAPISYTYSFNQNNLILYNLGLNIHSLPYVYENTQHFSIVPTHINQLLVKACGLYPFHNYLKNYELFNLVHAEQHLMTMTNVSTVLEDQLECTAVMDYCEQKQKNCIVRLHIKAKGKCTIEGYVVLYIRQCECSPFGQSLSELKLPSSVNSSKSSSFTTDKHQAQLFRLSGDVNPLHIDPDFAKMGGFKQPILHGMCTMGIACYLIMEEYKREITSIQCRLTNVVYPGEELQVVMDLKENKLEFKVQVNKTVLIGQCTLGKTISAAKL